MCKTVDNFVHKAEYMTFTIYFYIGHFIKIGLKI